MADKKKGHDNDVLLFWFAVLIVLICIVLWLGLSEQISSGVRWIRIGELKLASLFTDRYDAFIEQLEALQPKQIRPIHLLYMTEQMAKALGPAIAGIMVFMALVALFSKTKNPYTRRLNLEKVVKEQASAFPVTMPVVRFNPLAANHRMVGGPLPEKLPMFAEALSPDEWVAYHSLPLVDGTVDPDPARRAFAKQLCGRWQGSNALPWHGKALFAAFAMKAQGQRTESDEFLGRVAQCWDAGKGLALTAALRKEIWQVMQDPKLGRVLEKIALQHAFTAPALLRCLQHAREQGGVLAPAQFVWLRAVDRTLWYPLNNLGRGSVHIEAAGAIAHYRTERAAGKPIPNPQVDVAVEGLVAYLRDNDVSRFPSKEFARA